MSKFLTGLTMGLLLFAGVALASGDSIDGYTAPGPWPEGVDVWVVDGKVFVRSYEENGEDHFWWWCEGECSNACPAAPVSEITTVNEVILRPTDKPPMADTSTPNAPQPTAAPQDDKCNRGLGNGSEGCDPGNSGGKPGKAGEDEG